MNPRLSRALDWCADNVGNVFFLALAAIVAASVLLVVVLAAASAF